MSWQPSKGPQIGIRNQYHNSNKHTNTYWKSLKGSLSDQSNSNVLPLYKDKPNDYTPRVNKRASVKERRKIMLYKGTILLIAFYVCFYVGRYLKTEVFPEQFQDSKNEFSNWGEAQLKVKQAFKDSWAQYEKYGWGTDEYHPVSKKGKNMGPEPLGWIIVDSLDTMLIMGLEEEYKVAESWVANELKYDFDYDVNVFETTIRMLGGLLSAYYLSENEMYLEKATDLGNKILGAFESSSGLPYSSVNLKTGKGKKNHVDNGASSTAEVSTLQLEFKYLSKLTGESLYWEKVEKIMSVLDDNKPKDGLVPIYVHPDTGKYQGNLIRLGSRGDSYYEYMLKQYLQTVEKEPVYLSMYKESVQGMKDHLLKHSKPNNLAFFGELEHGLAGEFSNKMDHLVCFMGGLLALGATEGVSIETARKSSGWDSIKEDDFLLAKDITHTCYKMYADTATGLSPEIVVFNTNEGSTEDFHIKPLDKHNLQRPETVESLFILYRITKDPIYRKWGWEIFQSFEKYGKLADGGYTSLDDVTTIPPKKRDNLESFWLAETLKYLYLLFDDSEEEILPLDKVVFNTEAHPFPVFEMNPLFKTGWSRKKQDEARVVKGGDAAPVRGDVHDPVHNNDKAERKKETTTKKQAPSAAKPAKPAIEELKDQIGSVAEEVKEAPFGKKASTNGEDVNEILEDLIQEEEEGEE